MTVFAGYLVKGDLNPLSLHPRSLKTERQLTDLEEGS